MGLIGYFNLSPPRVLDLILEVASCHVTAHWRFFLELLRCSPWGTTAQDSPPKGKGKAKADANWVDFEVDEVLHAMDGLGDRVLAQVLGVKFGFYQASCSCDRTSLADEAETRRRRHTDGTGLHGCPVAQAWLCRSHRSSALPLARRQRDGSDTSALFVDHQLSVRTVQRAIKFGFTG